MTKSQKLSALLTQKGYEVDNVTWVPIGASGGVGIDGWTVEFVGASPAGVHGYLGNNYDQALSAIDKLSQKNQ